MGKKREELLKKIWAAQDEAYALMFEYDSLPHRYGDNTLYQAEAHIVDLIGEHPDITITELAVILSKSPSACSQIVRKLRAKGWVLQIRNQENNRQFNLRLTEDGLKVYQEHDSFERKCQIRTFEFLNDLTEEELTHHLIVQQLLNTAYREDVRASREYFH